MGSIPIARTNLVCSKWGNCECWGRRTILVLGFLALFLNMCYVGYAQTDSPTQNIYDMFETLNKISSLKDYLGIQLSEQEIYEVVSKYYSDYDSSITQDDFQKMIDDLTLLSEQKRKEERNDAKGEILLLGIMMAIFACFFLWDRGEKRAYLSQGVLAIVLVLIVFGSLYILVDNA